MSCNGATVPEYLSEGLFQDALNEGFQRKDVKVKSLKVKLISEGGENYCSDIYRANVEYTIGGKDTEHIALIVKDMKESFNRELPNPSKEIDMYMQMVPKMEEVLGEKGAFAPKCFKATKDHNELYIFQDLGDLGYAVQDRLKGLNEDQVHVLLKKIGAFHAASMVVAEKHPAIVEKVGHPYFEEGFENVPLISDLVFGNLEYVTELAKDWEGFEDMAIKLQKVRKDFDKKFVAMYNSNQTRYKVLNHGDLWVNNMMFKHEKDTCVDVKLIDLQICCYASPGVDLHYFFTTSIPLDLGLPKKYDLLRVYYKAFKTTLLRLNYSPIPSWDDLLNELRATEFYALMSVILAVPLICLEKNVSKGNDLDTWGDSDLMKKQRVHMYQSKRTLATTRYVLDRLNDLGLLD